MPGNCVAVILWLYSSVLSNLYCFLSYYDSYPAARISASITALGSLISFSLESVVVA